MKDYDIEYLYFANQSPKDLWENIIKEYDVNVAPRDLDAFTGLLEMMK